MTSCSLIISTYNSELALKKCLQSVFHQTVMPDEIIIADDGSGEPTRKVIEEFKKETKLALVHVWHEDKGFRLAQIRNKAIKASKFEYIIQIDGDLILHPDFVKDHLRLAKKSCFFFGSRSCINQTSTQHILNNAESPYFIPPKDSLEKKYNAIHFYPLAKLLFQFAGNNNSWKYVKGCNMAFWKNDLMKVNGYNEQFKGWGKEDNDICIRLMNTGLKIKPIRFASIVYHLYHKENIRTDFQNNELLMLTSIKNKVTYVKDGIIKE